MRWPTNGSSKELSDVWELMRINSSLQSYDASTYLECMMDSQKFNWLMHELKNINSIIKNI